MRRVVLFVCVLALWAAGVGASRAEEPTLEHAVGEFLAAEGEAQKAAARAIVERKPAIGEVVAALAKGRTYSKDVERGWLKKMQKGSDGKERPCLLYVPSEYDPARSWRLVIDMHGGVSRKLLTHEELSQMRVLRGEHAERNGYFLALPAGENGAEWWTEVGASTVLGVISSTKRVYNVDENGTIATGFSDGGSGAYYLALAHPTPFAAFVPLNGHVGVASVGGLDVHLEGLRNKPIRAVNTDLDSLYPSAALKPISDALVEMKAPFLWREITGFRHDPSYLATEREPIWAWEQAQKRDPHPATIVWAGGFGAPSRVHGLGVVEVDREAGGVEPPDVNPLLPPGKPRLGITLDTAHAGPGLAVAAVQEGSAAQAAGIAVGDVVVAFDEAEVTGQPALRRLLDAKKAGDTFRVTVERGGERKDLSAAFPEAQPQPAFRRSKPWGSVELTRTGNAFTATTWNVGAFELWIGSGTVDLAAPITVTVNGREAHRGVVAPDVSFLLARASEDDDRTMHYVARLRVLVPAAAVK